MQDEPFFDEHGNQINDQKQQLTTIKPDGEIVPESTQLTAQEHRVNYVAKAVEAAYMKVGTLILTDEEYDRITAKFPDSFVEILPHNGQIYIPHIHISNRFTQVFKAQWDFVRTREWLTGAEMFAEYVLIIRGVAKGETVSSAKMQDRNRVMSYDDVLESTRGIALRRVAGKSLSCGSQVWDSDYAKEWTAKYGYKDQKGLWKKRTEPVQAERQQPEQQSTPSPEQAKPSLSEKQVASLLRKITNDADEGMATLENVWKTLLSVEERKALAPYLADLKLMAKEADKKKAQGYQKGELQ